MSLLDSPWLRHPRIWITIGVLGWAIAFSLALADRDPPTIVPDLTESTAVVQAGTELRIAIPVKRDLSKRCSVKTTRFLIDSTHATRTLVPTEYTSMEGRKLRERESPSVLNLVLPIESHVPEGSTLVQTENQYVCLFNPTTWIVPIDDSWAVRFYVTQAKSGVVIIN